jgi:hypothetical protein
MKRREKIKNRVEQIQGKPYKTKKEVKKEAKK